MTHPPKNIFFNKSATFNIVDSHFTKSKNIIKSQKIIKKSKTFENPNKLILFTKYEKRKGWVEKKNSKLPMQERKITNPILKHIKRCSNVAKIVLTDSERMKLDDLANKYTNKSKVIKEDPKDVNNSNSNSNSNSSDGSIDLDNVIDGIENNKKNINKKL